MSFLERDEFEKSLLDPCLRSQWGAGALQRMILLDVDDMVLMSQGIYWVREFKGMLKPWQRQWLLRMDGHCHIWIPPNSLKDMHLTQLPVEKILPTQWRCCL